MGAPTAFRARIESRRGNALGDVMSSMRVWLDRSGIDVVAFDFVPATRSSVAFDVYFRNEVDVVLFQHEFARRHGSRTPTAEPGRTGINFA
jgi:hypothetical protein